MAENLEKYLSLYFKHNYSVVPMTGKIPQVKGWPNSNIKDMETFRAHSNDQTTGAAFLCGADNGVYCLDIDPRNGGFESLKRFEEEFRPLPNTVTVETGGGGIHLYFYHDKPIPKLQSVFPGIDFQGTSSLAIIAGSKHESSNEYKFKGGCGLGEVEIAPIPQVLLNLLESSVNKNESSEFIFDDESEIPEGQRDEALFRIGLHKLNQGFDPNQLHAALAEINRARVKPPISEKQLEKIVKSCLKNTKKFYGIMEGCLAKVGEKLCNFDLRISKEVIRDDGKDQTVFYELVGQFANGDKIRPFVVPSSEFFNHSFIAKIGRKAIPVVGPFTKDHIKSAIQDLSEFVEFETIYTHTGFKKIGDEWVFLHSNGAIGSKGNNESVKVDLMLSQLSAYNLEFEPDTDKLREYIRANINLLDVAPDYISIPMISRNFRAPLAFIEPVGSAFYLTGPTGCFKSTLLGLKLSSFGRTFSYNRLPGNFESTANSIENIGFRLKDVPFGIDDLAPDGSLADVQAKGRMAARVFRAIGNGEGSGRSRMNADGTLRTSYYFRCSTAITAEDVVKGASIRARCLIVPLSKGDVDQNKLTHFQTMASNGVFVKVMSAYISWLCPKIEDLQKTMPEKLIELRGKASQLSGHNRTPDAIANLAFGFELFLDFALDVGSITKDKAEILNARAWQAFRILDEIQKPFHTAEDPSRNFIDYLRAAFVMGKCHLKNYRDSQKPPYEYESLGWVYDGEHGDLKPKGNSVGYVDVLNEEVMLEPNAAFSIAQEIARSQGSSINITRDILWKRLSEAGFIIRSESEGKNTVKRSPDGTDRSRFIVFSDLTLFTNSGFDSNQRERNEHPITTLEGLKKFQMKRSRDAH